LFFKLWKYVVWEPTHIDFVEGVIVEKSALEGSQCFTPVLIGMLA
jgi:hypothetical protein